MSVEIFFIQFELNNYIVQTCNFPRILTLTLRLLLCLSVGPTHTVTPQTLLDHSSLDRSERHTGSRLLHQNEAS